MNSTQQQMILDLHFPVIGKQLPVDHGYTLFSALCHISAELHSNHDLAVSRINGLYAGNRMLTLTETSKLILRLPSDMIKDVMSLAGKKLIIKNNVIRLGIPQVQMLQPSAQLKSYLVTIKGKMDTDSFLESANRQLQAIGVSAEPKLIKKKVKFEGTQQHPEEPYIRRTLRISGKEVVGYPLMFEGLSPEDSLNIQIHGVGGRRRFGCGLFLPTKQVTS